MKSLQVVASLTAERDGETRKAALNTLAIGYKILGECLCSVRFLVMNAGVRLTGFRF